VFAGVGQRLLHDPVRVPAQPIRYRRPAGQLQVDGGARLPGLLDQRRHVGQRGLRAVVRGLLAQHADDLPQVLQREVRGLPDHAGRRAFGSRRAPAHFQGAGMQGQQGDPVCQHVVHLPGDLLPLAQPGLLDPHPLTLLGLPGAFGQRADQHPVRADQHGHRNRADVQQHQEGHGFQVGAGGRDGQPVDHHDGGRVQRRQRDRDAGGPVQADREECDRQRAHRKGEHDAERHQREGQCDRVGAAEQQQPAEREHPDGDFQAQRGALALGDGGEDEENAEDRGNARQGGFHQPLARRPSAPHVSDRTGGVHDGQPPTVDPVVDLSRSGISAGP
jgi:hypothetical protein